MLAGTQVPTTVAEQNCCLFKSLQRDRRGVNVHLPILFIKEDFINQFEYPWGRMEVMSLTGATDTYRARCEARDRRPSFDASEKWQIRFYTLVYPCLTPWLRLFDHLEDARFRNYLERPLELDFPIEVGMKLNSFLIG